MESKIRFKVTGRLLPSQPFKELEVNSKFCVFADAQRRMQEWLAGALELPKAKPEVQIETEELPHIIDCKDCGTALFKDEIVYYTRHGISCYECSETTPDGLYDLLDYPENIPDFSLDKAI